MKRLTASECLPADAERALLVGRIWRGDETDVPA